MIKKRWVIVIDYSCDGFLVWLCFIH